MNLTQSILPLVVGLTCCGGLIIESSPDSGPPDGSEGPDGPGGFGAGGSSAAGAGGSSAAGGGGSSASGGGPAGGAGAPNDGGIPDANEPDVSDTGPTEPDVADADETGGLGTATVMGASPFNATNAWAFHSSPNPQWGYDLSTNPDVIQIMISDGPALTCATTDTVSEGAVNAITFAAFEAGGEPATEPGTFTVIPPHAPPLSNADYAVLEEFVCSGGGNSCLLESPETGGTVTITSMESPITGTFSVTFGTADAGVTTGTFSAPICD